jgi:hypothetical protein
MNNLNASTNDYFFSKEEWIAFNHFDAVSISPDEVDSCLRVNYYNKHYYDRLCDFGDANSVHSEAFTLKMFNWFKEPNLPEDFLGTVRIADGSRISSSYDNYPSTIKFEVYNKGNVLVKNVPSKRVWNYYYHKSVVGASNIKHGTEIPGVSDKDVRKYPYITLDSDNYNMPAIVVDCDLENSVENYLKAVNELHIPPCTYYIENRENGHAQFVWIIRGFKKNVAGGRLLALYQRLWLTLTVLLNSDVHFTRKRFQNPYYYGIPVSSRHIVVPDAEHGFRWWSLQGLVCDLHNRGLLIPETELQEKYGYEPFNKVTKIIRFTQFDVFRIVGLVGANEPTVNSIREAVKNSNDDTMMTDSSLFNGRKIDVVKDKNVLLHSGRGGLNPQLFTLKTLYEGCRFVCLFRMLTYIVWHTIRPLLLTTSDDNVYSIVKSWGFKLRDNYCVENSPLPNCEIVEMSKQVAKYFINKTKTSKSKIAKNMRNSAENVNITNINDLNLVSDLLSSTITATVSSSSPYISAEQREMLVRMGRNGGRAKTEVKRASSAKNISGINAKRKLDGLKTAIEAYHAVAKYHTVGQAAKRLNKPRTTIKSAFLRYYSSLVNNVDMIVEDFIIKNNLHHAGLIRRRQHLDPIYGLSAVFFMSADASFIHFTTNMLENAKNKPNKQAEQADSKPSSLLLANVSTKFNLNVIAEKWLDTNVANHVYIVYRNLILFALAASACSRNVRWTRGCTEARKLFVSALKGYRFDGHEYNPYANSMFEDLMIKVFEIMTEDKGLKKMADKILDNAIYKKRVFDNMPAVKYSLDSQKLMDVKMFKITA